MPSDADNESNLPPLIFPKENVTIGSGLPPVIFPSENFTIGVELPPVIFPTENVTIGDGPKPVITSTEKLQENDSNMPPLIFPKTKGSVPLIELPPLIFPSDTNTEVNQTALDILNANENSTNAGDMHILPIDSDDDYYKDSSEDLDDSNDVEEVQANDKGQQKDNLEENYK